MSNGTQKKGLPALAWVAIGCGVILLVVAIAVVAGGVFVAKKVKDVAGDFEKNPALATARTIVRLNPELEEVAVDEDAGTITVREKKTGKELTVSFEDLKEGRISFTSSDGETMTLSGGEEGVRVTDERGSTVFSAGAAGRDGAPDWVPVYPGTSSEGGLTMRQQGRVSGSFSLATGDSPEKVLEYFRKALGDAGFEVRVNSYSEGSTTTGGVVYGQNEATKRTVTVMIGVEDGTTTGSVSYSEGE